MNENAKTILFAAVAIVVFATAWLLRPVPPGRATVDRQGELLCEGFNDPLKAARLEIVKYDKKSGDVLPFEVAQVDGRWSIPSHDDYPTDGKDQLVEAAGALTGLRIISVASSPENLPGGEASAGNFRQIHNMYGVIEPDPKNLKPGEKGIGTRATIKDANGNALLSLVIGKKVEGEQDVRYVREVGKDPVYTVKIDSDKLSTKFEDWIEKNLLDINTFDIKEVRIQDYTMSVMQGRVFSQVKGQMTLEYDDGGDPKWRLTEEVAFAKKKGLVAVEMAEDEELDNDKLNDLKFALDDLKIVDVNRKPAGLSADLTADGSFYNDEAGVISMQRRGFYVVQVQGAGEKPQYEVLSNKGEIRLAMKDGVEYLLRFGEISGRATGTGDEEDDGAEKKEGEEEAEESSDAEVNRYLLVMARFDADMIPKPELESLPEETPAAEAEQPAEDAAAKPAEDAAEEEPGTAEATDEKGDATESKAETPEEKPEEETEEASQDEDPVKTEEKKKEELAAERERIEKDNQRKQEEYDEKLEKGRERVKELNARFADWYYVISDDVYKKIHLGRDKIVKKKKDEKKDGDDDDDHAGHDHEGHDHAAEGHAEQDPPAEELGPRQEFNRLKSEGPEGE